MRTLKNPTLLMCRRKTYTFIVCITQSATNIDRHIQRYIFFLILTCGANMAWTSPMIKKLNGTEDNPLGRILTVDESSWVASISILGSIIGSLICGALGRIFGRKILITSMGIPYAIFYVTLVFAEEVWLYLVARFIGGISAGGLMVLLPMYITELAKPEVRGRLFVLTAVLSNVGSVITYSTAPFISFFWYHICTAILPIIFLILFPIFALESPYYIVDKDVKRAENILKQLMGKDDVTKEIERLKMDQEKTSDLSLVDVFKTRRTRKALLISLGLITFSTISGYTVIMSYAQFLFDSAGAAWSAEIDTIILSVFQLVSTALTSVFADRFGRKSLLAISFGALSFSEGILGFYLILKDGGVNMDSMNKWLPIFSLIICVAASSFLLVAPSIPGELFCVKAKNVAMAMVIVLAGLLGFLTTFLFQRVQNAIGLGQSFLIFGVFSICGVIYVLTVLIETKGKSLEQIQDELGGVDGEEMNEKV